MRKVFLVIQREYFTRVKKKSFILLTILGPILISAIIAAVVWFGLQDENTQKVLVVDELYPVFEQLNNSEKVLKCACVFSPPCKKK